MPPVPMPPVPAPEDSRSRQAPPANFGMLLLAGVGAGALTGVLLGLVATRRPRAQARDEITETVEDLRRRAEQILTELSHAAAPGPPAPSSLNTSSRGEAPEKETLS